MNKSTCDAVRASHWRKCEPYSDRPRPRRPPPEPTAGRLRVALRVLDGGDVLRIGRTLFVGASGRSNPAGMEQLSEAVQPFGYAVVPVPLTDCLHLKTAATLVKQASSHDHGDAVLLINPDWVDRSHFGDMRCIVVSPDEPFAANALLIGESVLYAAGFPKTADRMRDAGIDVRSVDVSELAKAEGGVTCCSIVFKE